MGALFDTIIDSVPIVGDIREMYGTLAGIREKGIVNSAIRGGLSLVPNGPWTSVAEGATRFTGGKGWEQTVADWVTGSSDKAYSNNPNEVDLSNDMRKQIVEMSREVAAAAQKGKDIEKVVEDKIEELENIKDPNERAAAVYAFSQLSEVNIQSLSAEFGNISIEQYQAQQNAISELRETVGEAGYDAVDSGVQRPAGKSNQLG